MKEEKETEEVKEFNAFLKSLLIDPLRKYSRTGSNVCREEAEESTENKI